MVRGARRGRPEDVGEGQAGAGEELHLGVEAGAVGDEAVEEFCGVGADEDGDAVRVHAGDAGVGEAVVVRLPEPAADAADLAHQDEGRDGGLVLAAHLPHVGVGQGLVLGGVGDEFPADGAGDGLGVVVGRVADYHLAGGVGPVLDDLLVLLLRLPGAVDEDFEVVDALAEPGLHVVGRVFFAVDQPVLWEAGDDCRKATAHAGRSAGKQEGRESLIADIAPLRHLGGRKGSQVEGCRDSIVGQNI